MNVDLAADWARGSLAQGSELARLMTRRLPDLSGAFVVAPEGLGPVVLDDVGRGIGSRDADAAVQRVLVSMIAAGATTLVVEDDLARRGDAAIPAEAVFVGDRVLHWMALDSRAAGAARLLRTGSSGYPLNAVICRLAPGRLHLLAGRELGADDVSKVADGACALITAVFDAESYLVLAAPDLGLSPPGV